MLSRMPLRETVATLAAIGVLAAGCGGRTVAMQTFAENDVPPPCGVVAIAHRAFDVSATGVRCEPATVLMRTWVNLRKVPRGWHCGRLRCWRDDVLETSTVVVVARSHRDGLPAPVSVDALAGVTPGMPASLVESRWRVPIVLERFASGCATADVPSRVLLGSGMQGFALFDRRIFAAAFFWQGAQTDAGIGIYSRVGDLRRAYGDRLRLRPPGSTRRGLRTTRPAGARYYYVARGVRQRWQVQFEVVGGEVTQIAFGRGPALRFVAGCPRPSA
jgi:hypothetical protein